MDLKTMAVQMLSEKLGSNIDAGTLGTALDKLIGGGSQMDLAGLVSQFAQGGLADAVSSWLGDGANSGISASQIGQVLGAGKLAEFASSVGVDEKTAGTALADVLPALVDQNSRGGSLLDSVGGLGDLAGMAAKFT